jgi:hypothetical protein
MDVFGMGTTVKLENFQNRIDATGKISRPRMFCAISGMRALCGREAGNFQ